MTEHDISQMGRMCTFHREDESGVGFFYPLLVQPHETVEQHAKLNPGTLEVKDLLTGETLWHHKPH